MSQDVRIRLQSLSLSGPSRSVASAGTGPAGPCRSLLVRSIDYRRFSLSAGGCVSVWIAGRIAGDTERGGVSRGGSSLRAANQERRGGLGPCPRGGAAPPRGPTTPCL